MMNRILTLIMALFVANSVTAAEYYVSQDGKDKNKGTLKRPFRTISKAASIMEAGDVCVIKEGVYRETIKPANSGTADKPIIFKSYEDDRVVIDATELVEEWTQHSDGIYKASMELERGLLSSTLFHNGDIFDIARWPNNSDDDRFTFDGHKIKGGSASTFEVEGLPKVDFKEGYFCYLGAHSGTSWSRRVRSYEEGLITFDSVNIKKWPFTPHNPTVFRNKNRGQLYLYGKLELLDQAKEWHYDEATKTIYAMFAGGKAPKAGSVNVGIRPTTIELNTDYIHIDGLECFGGMVMIGGNHCKVTNSKLQNCSQSLDGIEAISAQSGNATIVIKGNDITIENNLIEHGVVCGVLISAGKNGKNYKIHNNVIRYFNTLGIHANPIRSSSSYTTITNNTIYTCGRDGICTSGSNTEIAYNDVYDCMRINNDGGVYYTVGNTGLRNSIIHHNYFHDSYGPAYADGRAAGVYLDNDSKGFDVYNNVVWNITWSALMINWYNTDINFFNNTIWAAGSSVGRWANGRTMDRVRIVNNYSSSISGDKESEWMGTDIESNLIDAESPFVSVEKCDFRPAEGSTLIDKGIKIDGFTKEYKGTAPDLGAYEHGEKLWSVGASWADTVK